MHSFNDIYYPILFLGIIAAGGIFAGSNPGYTQYELAHHIKTAKVRFLISEPEILSNLQAAAKECNIPQDNFWIFDPLPEQNCPEGAKSWQELLSHGEKDWVRFNDLKTCSATTAARLFSSGTTGLPKAACLTHHNFIAQHELVYEGPNKKPYDLVQLFPMPFFHAAIAPRVHTSVLKAGWKSYVMRRFELEPFFAYSEKYQVTEAGGVPPMIIAMIMSPLRNKYSLKSAKGAMCGGAPLGAGPQKRFEHLLGGAPFTQVYGMTETSCIAMMTPWPEMDHTGGSGRPIANLDVKLVNDDGQDITAYDTRGEICFRGPVVTPGYFENPEANKASFDADGFFHTGDIGYCDSKTKMWYIIDRKKELIKVRGFQVAPPELEAVLLSHPDIVDAGVIGVPASDYEGEAPRAYVVRRPGSDASKLTAEVVKEYAGEKLSKYKRLEGGIMFVDAIPKNASGKILKRVLRDQAKKELGLSLKL